MNPILDIVRSGGIRAVATLAAEAVGTVATASRTSRRSLQSLAIAQLRREFPALTRGTSGYEVARNVWRRAVRLAKRVASWPDAGPGGAGGTGGGRPPRGRPRGDAETGTYVYRVKFVSPRGVERWRTVTYRGPAGLSDDALRSVANAKLSDGPDVSPGQRRGRDYISQQSTAQTVVVLMFDPDR